ncbi:MAG: RNA polymerase sigma factor [Gammaproteobacteria bacterium]
MIDSVGYAEFVRGACALTDAVPDPGDEQSVAEDLVARIARGDESAETELWNRYSRGLLFLLRRRTRDPDLADDLRQETFRIALEKLRAGGLDDPGRLAAYLRGIAVNLVTGDWRKRVRRNTEPDSDRVAEAADVSADPMDEASRQQIAVAIDRLLAELGTTRDRHILRRYYVDEADKARICGELDISQTHFNRVLFRAKQRFRTLLLSEERRGKLGLVE